MIVIEVSMIFLPHKNEKIIDRTPQPYGVKPKSPQPLPIPIAYWVKKHGYGYETRTRYNTDTWTCNFSKT